MSKNPFYTFEVVVTNKLQETVAHQVMHASSWRVEYYVNDYSRSKEYKGYSVWVRKQLGSMELTENSGWSWNIKAKNAQEAKDYSALVEWEPWVNVTKETNYVRNLVEEDNKLADKLRKEEIENA